ncbi:hypothetical protein L1049_025358 [Liquidambar formosana]|uniref:Glycosyl transferase 48 domain-containing protein n=1 Tax=Liquidambar formosana TaxID=63359 RepID=A0AAP0N4Y8_LIQFO
MAHRGRGRRGRERGNVKNFDIGVEIHPHMGRIDTKQQKQQQIKEIGELRIQIGALTDIVPLLQPPHEVFDASYDIEIPDFQGSLDPEDFLLWTNPLERVFAYHDISEDQKVKIAKTYLGAPMYDDYHDNAIVFDEGDDDAFEFDKDDDLLTNKVEVSTEILVHYFKTAPIFYACDDDEDCGQTFEVDKENSEEIEEITSEINGLSLMHDMPPIFDEECEEASLAKVTVLTLYVFLYGHLFMVLSGLERAILENLSIHQSKNLEEALASQSLYQLGFLMVLPMVMETGLEKGFHTALGDFIIMQLQLASVFFTFQLGTKTHYYGRTILHGGSKYRSTGRSFVVFHAKFADNYRLYSRSHFVKGLELLILLLVYKIYGNSHSSSNLYWFITFSMWLLVGSWLLAPFVFNPSGFDWQKTVEDWKDWKRWMGSRCRIGIPPEKSWESWWDEEQGHLKKTSFWGRVLEIILAFRFLIYQYGIVYHLNIANHSKSVLVYVLSWVVMAIALLILKVESASRQRSAPDCQLMLRILKGLLFLVPIFVMPALFVICGLTVSDLLASILAFMPTGWALLLIAQACKSWFKALRLWGSVKELGRAYDYIMGLLIFTPIVILSWFPFISEFQTRMLFNQAFSRGLQISMILAGKKDKVFQKTSTTPPSNNTKDKAKPS